MKWIFLVFLLLSPAFSEAQKILSKSAEVSIITLGPYQEEVYSAFGHSAIRIHDPETGEDLAFNYGTFTFDSSFYINFLRGNLRYKLGVSEYAPFRDFYISENRFVHEQVLNLDSVQKQKVYNYLHNNIQPQNATYQYDYFYNNCSTKVRDLFVELFGEKLKFDGSYLTSGYSIRDLTHMYLGQQPWGELGIEICLGSPMDKRLSKDEYMFLPDYTESGFDHATLGGVPIVREKKEIYRTISEAKEQRTVTPRITFLLLFMLAVVISVNDWRRRSLSTWFDTILFALTGCVGIILMLLWLFTAHTAAAQNYNLLWAVPFHLGAALLLLNKRLDKILKRYFIAVGALSCCTLLLWFFLPQQLNVALIPLVLTIAIRSFLISRLAGQ